MKTSMLVIITQAAVAGLVAGSVASHLGILNFVLSMLFLAINPGLTIIYHESRNREIV